MLSENELWILSFYRVSEISGALFFGRLARSMQPGRSQEDMTKHFSDEAVHAWYWTDGIQRLDAKPLKLDVAYQDQYLTAAGMPVNMMEILAITQVFERRVMNQYKRHSQVPGMHPVECQTIARIMRDERWHIKWIREALKEMEPEYGKDHVNTTLKRYMQADLEVYRKTMAEHEERVGHLIQSNTRGV
jgi:bacterioferritin (cytochrome b1)